MATAAARSPATPAAAFCNPLMPGRSPYPFDSPLTSGLPSRPPPVAIVSARFSMCMQIYLRFVLKIYFLPCAKGSYREKQRRLRWGCMGYGGSGRACNTPQCTRTMTPIVGKSLLGLNFKLLPGFLTSTN